MSLKNFVIGQVRRPLEAWTLWQLSRQHPGQPPTPENWPRSLTEPLAFYLDCVRYFYHGLPQEYRAHRLYFHGDPGNRRGFGEHAFHVMWYQLLEHLRPKNFLEIGVFRGQVICLVAYWAKLSRTACDVWGVSPFSPAGDSVSKYATGIDYHTDTLANFAAFDLPKPNLVRAYSTDAAGLETIRSREWDLVYIDGNHDYEVARADWEACSRQTRVGGAIVLDDAGLSTAYQPPLIASRGHPGPSRVAQEIDRRQFQEILQVGHNRVFRRIA